MLIPDEAIKGAMVVASLIVALGAQNVFVLKQALLRQHLGLIATICFLCDVLLMAVGVFGIGGMISQSVLATKVLAIAGALFLTYYGLKSLYSAAHPQTTVQLEQGKAKSSITSAKSMALATLAVTLLNPHVYLDTVVIIGGIAATLSLPQKLSFLLGASSVSLIWFYGLTFGAQLLTPWFKKPKVWMVLECIIGLFMLYLAYGLLQICLS